MPPLAMKRAVATTLAGFAAVGIGLVACGDDTDERSGTDQVNQQAAQEAPDARRTAA